MSSNPNFAAVDTMQLGEVQAYGRMLDAFYPFVSSRGAVDLFSASPVVDPVHEDLLELGYEPEVLRVLTAQALRHIPHIKQQKTQLQPESFMGELDAEAA